MMSEILSEQGHCLAYLYPHQEAYAFERSVGQTCQTIPTIATLSDDKKVRQRTSFEGGSLRIQLSTKA